MKLIGGRLCLDFTNTVGGRQRDAAPRKSAARALILGEKLTDYADLVAWSREAEILTPAEAQRLVRESKQRGAEAAAVLERAVQLRETIYRLCQSILSSKLPETADLETLNRELLKARSHERLARGANGFTWAWIDTKYALDRMLWPVAHSAAELLTTEDCSRLRECGGEDCGWLFEDTSRNRSRQWCDMQECGNRAKVRRFRTRQRSASKHRH